jgi:hypothetical protein
MHESVNANQVGVARHTSKGPKYERIFMSILYYVENVRPTLLYALKDTGKDYVRHLPKSTRRALRGLEYSFFSLLISGGV